MRQTFTLRMERYALFGHQGIKIARQLPLSELYIVSCTL